MKLKKQATEAVENESARQEERKTNFHKLLEFNRANWNKLMKHEEVVTIGF
jgi:hypothetical protein